MKVSGVFSNAQRTETVPAGSVIFQEGETGQEMYGVVSGQVELRTGDRVIAELGADDIFGEMALVDHSPRSATAVATSDSVLAVIDQKMFLFLIHETPTFALSVMSTMAARFRNER